MVASLLGLLVLKNTKEDRS